MKSFAQVAARMQDDVAQLRDRIQAGQRDDIDGVVHTISHHVDRAHRQLECTPPLSQRDIDRMLFHCTELATQSVDLVTKCVVSTPHPPPHNQGSP